MKKEDDYSLYKYYKGEEENPYRNKWNGITDFSASLWFSEKLFSENPDIKKDKEHLYHWIAAHLGGWIPMLLNEILDQYFEGNIPANIRKTYL